MSLCGNLRGTTLVILISLLVVQENNCQLVNDLLNSFIT